MRYSPNRSLRHLEPGGSALKLSLQSQVLRTGGGMKFNLIVMRVAGRPGRPPPAILGLASFKLFVATAPSPSL